MRAKPFIGFPQSRNRFTTRVAVRRKPPHVIVCSSWNHWCLESFRYDNARPGCVEQKALCDYGPVGNTKYGCENVISDLQHPLRCLNDFDGTFEGTPTSIPAGPDGPTWNGACCVFLKVANYLLASKQDITVY